MSYSEFEWDTMRGQVDRLDEKQISDEARRFADEDGDSYTLPENKGEWKASLELAFEAGRLWERRAALRALDEGRAGAGPTKEPT